MRSGLLLVVFALLAATLAGCTSPPPAQQAGPAQADEPQQAGLVPASDVANITQPDEQSDFAKSLDEKFHTHDYWDGLLEKQIMDADVASSPMLPDSEQGPFGVLFFLIRAGASPFGGGIGFTPFLLPEGSIVPPEADRLEVTVSWTQSNTITGLELSYRTASGDGDLLEPFDDGGSTVTIPTNLTNNDMPHTTLSKWSFTLRPYNPTPGEPAIFNGTAHVTITAFRNDTLFVAPPHPDLWGDNTTKVLFDDGGPLKGTRAGVPVFLPLDDGNDGFAFIELPENVTIAPHTGLLTLTLNWTNNATTPGPFHTFPELLYSPGNQRGQFSPDVASQSDGQTVYTIPVDARMADSPYDNQTRWRFWVRLDTDAPTDQGSFLGDIGDFDGDFHLLIVAERETAAM